MQLYSVHSQYYGPKLDSNFWVLVEALDEAARRCHNSSQRGPSLAKLFADQLRQLHNQLKENPDSKIHLFDSFGGAHKQSTRQSQGAAACFPAQRLGDASLSFGDTSKRKQDFLQGNTAEHTPLLNLPSPACPTSNSVENKDRAEPTARPKSSSNFTKPPPPMECGPLTEDSLSGILEELGDAAFMDMDRVISFLDLEYS